MKYEDDQEILRMNRNILEDSELYIPTDEEMLELQEISLNEPSSQYNTGQDVMWGKNGDMFGGSDQDYSPYPNT